MYTDVLLRPDFRDTQTIIWMSLSCLLFGIPLVDSNSCNIAKNCRPLILLTLKWCSFDDSIWDRRSTDKIVTSVNSTSAKRRLQTMTSSSGQCHCCDDSCCSCVTKCSLVLNFQWPAVKNWFIGDSRPAFVCVRCQKQTFEVVTDTTPLTSVTAFKLT